jgi:photosystem II stability/assembly factor-like uncharacterized protein
MKHFVSLLSIVACAAVAAFNLPAAAGATPDLSGLTYRSIGPAISGGRTTAVVGSDTDPLLYYAGGAGGGVFKSVDGGSTWTPVFDAADVAPVGAIAIAPRDERDVWVGTGESNPRNDVEGGDGIWHSTDGGSSWKHVGLDDAGAISSISIDPRDPRRIAVAVLGQVFRDNTMRGVYVTADAGAHWTHALFVGPSTGASDLVRNPDHPDTLFAGMYEFRRQPWTMTSGGSEGGIFRSDDDGATWRRLASNGLPPEPTGRIGLAAAHGGRIYALIQSSAGDLWRSDDGGTSWRLEPHSWLVGDRSFYFSKITVDPADANRLIDVGLILSMSTDGGRTFHKIATNAGWDYHQVWWSADGKRIGVGADEGVIMSSDGGTVWRQPYVLPFSQPYHVGFDDALPNYHVCVGLQDNDSWCGASNSDSGLGVLNRDWTTIGPGDGMWAVYDPLDPHLVWSTSTNSGTGQVYLWDSRTEQAYEVSPDEENSGGMPGSDLAHRFNWDSPISFTNDGKALVGGEVVFESVDHGQHWTVISPDLTRDEPKHLTIPGGPISADMSGAEMSDTLLDIEPSRVVDGLIWTGSDDGMVHVTRDGGAHWTDVTPPQAPHWGRVATVEPGRFEAGTAFVAFDNHMLGDERPHLFATGDFGKSWTSISGDLPEDLFVRSIRQDPKDASLLYAGTQRGVWTSWDSGAHWTSLRLNMPASAIYDIEIQPRADDLLVATHGRGVWVFDDLRPLQMLGGSSPFAVTLFPPRDTYRWWQWSPINSFSTGSLPADEFAGPNVPYGALFTYALPSGSVKTATIEIVDASGRVVRHLTGKAVPHKAGLNRTSWDLQEDGPTKWLGTFEANQGPEEGPEVVPGTYTVRLRVDGVVKEQPVLVKEDPRDLLTAAQMQQRHDALAELDGELSRVDDMLNDIDRRLKSASGTKAAALVAFEHRLTYPPRNAEDLGGPAQIRERLLDLIGRISSTSYQPPTQAQSDEAAALKRTFDQVDAAFRALGT